MVGVRKARPLRALVRLRCFAPLAIVAALALGACGDDSDVPLTIGVVLPQSGALGSSGEPTISAVRLAEEDIRAAGGEVAFRYADSGSDPATAARAVDGLLEEGADAILGAAASGVSQAFIQTLYERRVPQCSPSNTSPSFTTQPNAAYYFRTVASDTAVVHLMDDVILERGATSISILARDDDYGRSLAGLLSATLEGHGAAAEVLIYDPLKDGFEAEVDAVARSGADAVVLIAFEEGVQLLQGLLAAGFSADALYGSDGVYLPDLPGAVDGTDPGVLDGLTLFSTGAPQSEAYAAFSERLREASGETGGLAWGARAYDCAVILALAARAAGSADGDAVIAAVLGLTNSGTECGTYADCARLIDAGENIAYAGKSGPLRLDASGDPTVAIYAVSRYEGGALVEQSTETFELAR